MARQGINTGFAPNDGNGDSLLDGAVKINQNFSEIYSTFGDGTNLVSYVINAGTSDYAVISGYSTSSGIATVSGYATIAGYSTSSGVSTTSDYAVISGYSTSSGISTTASSLSSTANINTSGIITASSFVGDGSLLTNLPGNDNSGYANTAGIATYAVISGYSTSSGIATYATIAGYSTSSGVSTVSGYATIAGYSTSSGIATYATTAGIATASTANFTVGADLYVTGNISFGGTSVVLNATQLQVKDRDIVVGYTTDGSNNDVSNDTTANHGGISVASTVGTPILNIPLQSGINSNPSTYKQWMWVKSGNYSGLGTDVWLSNYAVSIGNTTTVQNGSRLTVGTGFTVYDTYLDATDIKLRNINVTGISTTARLNVGTGGTVITTTVAGSVGIGTTNPTNTLTVYGPNATIRINDTASNASTTIAYGSITLNSNGVIQQIGDTQYFRAGQNGSSSYYFDNYYSGSSHELFYIDTNGSIRAAGDAKITGITTTARLNVGTGGTVITTTVAGSVGIATDNPTSKLTVTGDVLVSGVVTATSFRGDGSQLTGISASGGSTASIDLLEVMLFS